MCNGATQSMEHLQTFGKSRPVLQHPNIPDLGFSNVNVQKQENTLICSFTRDNSITNGFKNYADLSSQAHFILFAYGSVSNEGGI